MLISSKKTYFLLALLYAAPLMAVRSPRKQKKVKKTTKKHRINYWKAGGVVATALLGGGIGWWLLVNPNKPARDTSQAGSDQKDTPPRRGLPNLAFIDKGASFNNTFERMPYTCYANAILQCLASVPRFWNYFTNEKLLLDRQAQPVAHALRMLFLGMQKNVTGKELTELCINLHAAFARKNTHIPNYKKGGVSTVSLYYQNLSRVLHEELSRLAGSTAEDAINTTTPLFKIKLKTTIDPESSEKKTNFFEAFSLHGHSEKKAMELEKSLKDHYGTKKLFTVKKPEKNLEWRQLVEIDELPLMCTISLDSRDNYHKITYPLNDLDLKELQVKEKQEVQQLYDLCAICMRTDKHYIADCKLSGGWYRFDDSDVRKVPKNEIGNQRIEFLFYQKRG